MLKFGRFDALFLFSASLILASTGCSLRERSMDDPVVELGQAHKFIPEEAPEPTESPELKSVYFDTNKSVLSESGREALRQNAEWMRNNPTTKVQIEGHCDWRGSQQFNLPLGERRAKAALDYLVQLGVEADRLSVVSYGRNQAADEVNLGKFRRASFYVIYEK